MREDALHLTLPDGRKLMIGGGVADYGDEYADPWVYNDVVVTHPDGAIEILTYPKEIFPHLYWPVDAVLAEHVYIFGILDRKRHPDRPRRPAVLRLDTQTFEIIVLPAARPSRAAQLLSGLGGPRWQPRDTPPHAGSRDRPGTGHRLRSGDAHLGRAGALS